MKRYQFTVVVDLQDAEDPGKIVQFIEGMVYPRYELILDGESLVSTEYTEVPIPELPT